jgi:hypothetical protein
LYDNTTSGPNQFASGKLSINVYFHSTATQNSHFSQKFLLKCGFNTVTLDNGCSGSL